MLLRPASERESRTDSGVKSPAFWSILRRAVKDYVLYQIGVAAARRLRICV
ncbi:hypothetical protein HMPREF9371_0197 [Neisseria shayeganii 871]|uniref:Uncharacterized protein n=1 Tax=Neisseria shayeganii 871 TaxID=1032488 RepID=G4CF08_9NEIS|nr:hypothetical protein HMPREF9371_0197 [Neisseria shayeganii 871]